MWLYQALIAALLFAIAGLFFKANSKEHLSENVFFFYLYGTGAAAILTYALITQQFVMGIELILPGALIGLGLGVGNSLFAKALTTGPISLTSPIINFNVVFLVAGAIIFFDETLTLKNSALITMLVLSVAILPFDPHEKLAIKNKSWYVLVIVSSLFFALRNGGLKVTNEMALDYLAILFIAYLLPALWYLPAQLKKSTHQGLHSHLFGITAGVFSVAGMAVYAVALHSGPASLVIPLFSTYNVFIVLLAFIFFKERLTLVQGISVAMIVLAISLMR